MGAIAGKFIKTNADCFGGAGQRQTRTSQADLAKVIKPKQIACAMPSATAWTAIPMDMAKTINGKFTKINAAAFVGGAWPVMAALQGPALKAIAPAKTASPMQSVTEKPKIYDQ